MKRGISAALLAGAFAASAASAQVHTQTHSGAGSHVQGHHAAHDSLMHRMHDSLVALHGISRDSMAAHHKAMTEVIAGELVGAWSGSFQSPHSSSGDFRFVIERGTALSGRLSLGPGQELQAGATRDLRLSGHTLTWSQMISGVQCRGSATYMFSHGGDRMSADSLHAALAGGHAAIAAIHDSMAALHQTLAALHGGAGSHDADAVAKLHGMITCDQGTLTFTAQKDPGRSSR